MRLFLFVVSSLNLSTGHAFAHGGHVGELAGHSHWVGWAALAGAAALAAWARKRRRRREDDKASDEGSVEENKA